MFSNSPSKHPAQSACLCAPPPLPPLYQLDGFYRHIHWWASWGIACSEQKDKVRERGAAEIRPLHCSQVVLFSWFYPPHSQSSFFHHLHLPLSDTLALTASPTDLTVHDLPSLVGHSQATLKQNAWLWARRGCDTRLCADRLSTGVD